MIYSSQVGSRSLTVGYVDASRDTATAEGEDVEGSEVGPKKFILLIGSGPRQQRQEVFSLIHQLLKTCTHLLVYHGDEPCV